MCSPLLEIPVVAMLTPPIVGVNRHGCEGVGLGEGARALGRPPRRLSADIPTAIASKGPPRGGLPGLGPGADRRLGPPSWRPPWLGYWFQCPGWWGSPATWSCSSWSARSWSGEGEAGRLGVGCKGPGEASRAAPAFPLPLWMGGNDLPTFSVCADFGWKKPGYCK